jgi:sugar phosphate permease
MSADGRLFLGVTLPLATLGLINQAARTVMAIIGPVLAVEFSLSGSELGLLAACMLGAYALAQIPDGVALDRLGPRRVQATLGLLTAAGFAAFALSDGLAGFVLARVIIGVGVSAGLMAVIKANTEWFVPAKVAKVTGIAVAIGGLGSVLTTAPVQAALPVLGWRGVLWLLAAISAAVAVWILLSVPEKPAAGNKGGLRAELSVTASVFRSSRFWRLGPAVAILSVLNFTYLGLWAGPWLRDVAGYDGQARANTLLLYTLSLMAGAVVIGAASSRVRAHGRPAMLVPLACITGQIAAQIGLALQPAGLAAVTLLWILFAFCAAGAAPGYVAVGQMFPAEQTGAWRPRSTR